MAGQNGSKGNPASTRMSNPKRKDKRARSWARGSKRKIVNRTKNEKQNAANQFALLELTGSIARRTVEVTKTVTVKNPKTGVTETKTKTRSKLESPSRALAHYRLESGLPKSYKK